MTEKQDLIRKMLEMQKRFIAYEQEHGVEPRDYWVAPSNHPLAGYKEEYADMAVRVIDLAHEEQGSKR